MKNIVNVTDGLKRRQENFTNCTRLVYSGNMLTSVIRGRRDLAVGIIVNSESELLTLRHVKFDCWTFPQGKIDAGESIIEGFTREMREELGINLVHYAYLYTYRTRDYDFHFFHIIEWGGDITNVEPEKCSGMRWIKFETPDFVEKENSMAMKLFWTPESFPDPDSFW